ncbi:unnamed protein product [Urochloa humidicola]
MVWDEECFKESGPKHITDINWGKEEHRRGIIACLVKATSLLESDRIKGRQDTPDARAPAWWEKFHFRLHRPLLCDYFCKCVFCKHFEPTKPFIYGAIFEHAPPECARRHGHPAAPPPPRFVVAFRGTKVWAIPDIIDDVRIVFNLQGSCSRFRKAREQVAELLASIAGSGGGGDDGAAVWLAGHSLGASVALDVGRDLMMGKKRERNLPTFLFNPPYVSVAHVVASTLRASEAARQDWFSFKCVAKGFVACTVMRSQDKMMGDLFRRLGPWVPELYVHKDDTICQGYIGQFERQEKILAKCTGILQPLAKLGVKHSFRDMMAQSSSSVRPNDTQQGHSVDDDEEVQQRVQPHLLPSVRLWKNSTKTKCPCHAHKLKHWWKPDQELNLSPKGYTYQA